MYSHRAIRHLAEALAERGFPVLRFDYFGTGDAEGEPFGPDHLRLWRESIATALAELRARSGLQTVAIAGLRFGATLAAIAAASDEDVDAVVLWDASVSGRSYLRQIQMFATSIGESSDQPTDSGSADGLIEAMGYVFTPGMIGALSAIDLVKQHIRPASRVLLLHRSGSSAHESYLRQLTNAGVEVTEAPYTGHDTFLITAERSVLPEAALQAIVQWLEAAYPHESTHMPELPDEWTTRIAVGGTHVHESIVTIEESIFGILTEPPTIDRAKPAVIFLNMGTDHHIGPRRMHVHLARHLATQGFASLRLDMPGVGDSPAPPGYAENEAYPSSALDIIGAAIEFLRSERGIETVVLTGMCGGAYHAVHGSRLYSAVVGALPINGPLFFQPGDSLDQNPMEEIDRANALRASLASGSQWKRIIRGEISMWRVMRGAAGYLMTLLRSCIAAFRPSRRNDTPAENPVDSLFARDVDYHIIYDAGNVGYRWLRHVGGARLAERETEGNFKITVIAGTGHAFIPLQGQARLNALITEWLVERYVTRAVPTVASRQPGSPVHH
jgi:pimeloyl-ACP methyl ester carboxylesterase